MSQTWCTAKLTQPSASPVGMEVIGDIVMLVSAGTYGLQARYQTWPAFYNLHLSVTRHGMLWQRFAMHRCLQHLLQQQQNPPVAAVRLATTGPPESASLAVSGPASAITNRTQLHLCQKLQLHGCVMFCVRIERLVF